ncbi:unnamed protein product [Gordionus sp. m RMFG-2023]|uniref:exostosin-3-like n=1 Tax=Gordionus sp. m RMFG-2023 TaxID=3053472 RepID=UPI0030DF5372
MKPTRRNSFSLNASLIRVVYKILIHQTRNFTSQPWNRTIVFILTCASLIFTILFFVASYFTWRSKAIFQNNIVLDMGGDTNNDKPSVDNWDSWLSARSEMANKGENLGGEEPLEDREERTLAMLYSFLEKEERLQRLEAADAPYLYSDYANKRLGINNNNNEGLNIPDNLTPRTLLKRIKNLLRIKSSVADQIRNIQDTKSRAEMDMQAFQEQSLTSKAEVEKARASLANMEERIREAKFVLEEDVDPRDNAGQFWKNTRSLDGLKEVIRESTIALKRALDKNIFLVHDNQNPSSLPPCTMSSCFDHSSCHLSVNPINGNPKLHLYDTANSPAYLDLLKHLSYRYANFTMSEQGSWYSTFFDYNRNSVSESLDDSPISSDPRVVADACLHLIILPEEALNDGFMGGGDEDYVGLMVEKIESLEYWRSHAGKVNNTFGANHAFIFVPANHNGLSIPTSISYALTTIFQNSMIIGNARLFNHRSTTSVFRFRSEFDIIAHLPPISDMVYKEPENLYRNYTYETLRLIYPDMLPIRKIFSLGYFAPYATSVNFGDVDNMKDVYDYVTNFMRSLNRTFPGEYLIAEPDESTEGIKEIFPNCTFTLFLSGGHDHSQLTKSIIETLGTGSVPLVLTPSHDPKSFFRSMPYSEYLDWSKAIVTFPLSRVSELPILLKTHLIPSEPHIFSLLKYGRHLKQTYFVLPGGSPLQHRNFNAILTILMGRLGLPFPSAKRVKAELFSRVNVSDSPVPDPEFIEYLGPISTAVEFTDTVNSTRRRYYNSFRSNLTCNLFESKDAWNDMGKRLGVYHPSMPWDPVFPTEAKFRNSNYGFRPINNGFGGTGKEFAKALGGNYPFEKFTIVMPTYQRENFLWKFLTAFKNLPYLDRIVLIWNDQDSEPSSEFELPNIGVPILIVKTNKNSLNNRFIPYDVIQTDAVLSLDDDLSLRHDEIIFAFRVWRESRDRIVGFPARHHAWNSTSKRWHYKSNHSCEYSMVLTGAAFIHQYYFYKYSYEMPAVIKNRVDEIMNCEDIAMNFLVSHITNKPPIKVTVRWTFRCQDCPESLWYSGNHYEVRSECINYFSAIYGYNPLLYSQYRADSVLFKTRVPKHEQKCFVYV